MADELNALNRFMMPWTVVPETVTVLAGTSDENLPVVERFSRMDEDRRSQV
jgi:hypothetical protein